MTTIRSLRPALAVAAIVTALFAAAPAGATEPCAESNTFDPQGSSCVFTWEGGNSVKISGTVLAEEEGQDAHIRLAAYIAIVVDDVVVGLREVAQCAAADGDTVDTNEAEGEVSCESVSSAPNPLPVSADVLCFAGGRGVGTWACELVPA